tara:strand:+ start:20 stop:352 length:333 start_codon:yes stop_codon:yes gene_type:complete
MRVKGTETVIRDTFVDIDPVETLLSMRDQMIKSMCHDLITKTMIAEEIMLDRLFVSHDGNLILVSKFDFVNPTEKFNLGPVTEHVAKVWRTFTDAIDVMSDYEKRKEFPE